MILLINPALPSNSPWGLSKMLPPLSLAYVAAALEKAGFEVKIFDNYLDKKPVEHIKQLVEKLNPKIVGVSCNSVNYKQCVEIARTVKKANLDCRVMVGGPHPSCLPEKVLDNPEIDYAIVGEGEQAATELARCISNGEDLKAISKIPGVAYKYKGQVRINPPVFIDSLDVLPYPARHLLRLDSYDRRIEYLDVEPADVMNVIRGCPYDCKFCETKRIWGYKCRSFSPSRIIDEVEHLMKTYGSNGIYFIGDNFTIFKEKTLELCELLKKRSVDVQWCCDTRVDLLSKELLEKMKAAGCKTIWFGVESGSPRVLEEVNRGYTVEQAIKAFRLCREVGIKTACSFMIGMPGETIEDMNASLKLAKKLNPDWCQFNIYIACPGSKMYDEVVEKRLYSHMDDFIAYVKTEDFDYTELLQIQKRLMKELNRSPRRIIRGIKRRILKVLIKV